MGTSVEMRVAVLVFSALALLSSCSSDPVEPPAGARSVSIATSDGASLPGYVVGEGDRVVVMSHGATSTMEGFYGIATAFAEDGWRVVLYDARDVEDRPTDLRGAMAFASRDGPETVVLLGGSIGASVSLSLAKELGADAVVALSPSATGFGALAAARALSIPVFVAAAADDQPFADDARRIADVVGASPVIVSGDAHAAAILANHPDLIDRIVRWTDDATAA